MNTTLSQNIRQMMDVNYLTEIELSQLSKVPQPTLHHILSGATKKPRRKAIEAIANALSVSVHELTGIKKLTSPKDRFQTEESLKIEIKKLREEIAELKTLILQNNNNTLTNREINPL